MARVKIDDDGDEALFSILDHSQGLQRRAYRIRARGFFNGYGIDEMRQQAVALLADIERLAVMAKED